MFLICSWFAYVLALTFALFAFALSLSSPFHRIIALALAPISNVTLFGILLSRS